MTAIGSLDEITQRVGTGPNTTNYAVFTGVQIHGPAHKDWIWVETSYVVVDGIRKPLL
jgi:hypothetical protein